MTLYEQYIQEVCTLESQESRDYYLSLVPNENHTKVHEYEMKQFLFYRQRTKVREMQAPENIRK